MQPVITLEALRVLDAIDRKGSFGQAAASLYKVPSALSYTVQKLESELGVSLFDRSRQRAQLTAAGRLLVDQGRDLLQAAARLEDAVRQLESGWETRLRIARDTLLPAQPLWQLVQAFSLLDKQVALHLTEEVLGGAWDALISDRCDLTLGASGELPGGVFEHHRIGEVEFVFTVAQDHPLVLHKGPVDAAAIRAFPTVVVADSSLATRSRSAGLLESRQRIRVPTMSAKIEAQAQGIGVGFLPRHLIGEQLRQGSLVILPCSVPRPAIPVYMAWRKGETGKALAWFVAACKAVQWLPALQENS